MIRAVIADDEPPARAQMRRLLSETGEVEVLAEAANGLEALELVAQHHPDAVFLDIEMPGLNGLEVAANLQGQPQVVFVTAYDEYAVKAFESNAVDYLLKPVQPERVRRTIERLRQAPQQTLQSLLDRLRRERVGSFSKLAARRGKRIVLVPYAQILFAQIEDKLVFVHTAQDKLLVDRTIGELEGMLEPAGFFRISRADLVNLAHVTEIVPWFSDTYRVKLQSGEELDVSRERGRLLKDRMGI
jgi:two-component system, LytTR family, response regulator